MICTCTYEVPAYLSMYDTYESGSRVCNDAS